MTLPLNPFAAAGNTAFPLLDPGVQASLPDLWNDLPPALDVATDPFAALFTHDFSSTTLTVDNPLSGLPDIGAPLQALPLFGSGLDNNPWNTGGSQGANSLSGLLDSLLGAFGGIFDDASDVKKGKKKKSKKADDEKVTVSDPATAISNILGDAGELVAASGGGKISTAGLAKVAANKDKDYSKELQASAKYLLTNSKVWDKITKGSGKTSVDGLSKALNDPAVLKAANGGSAGSETEKPINDASTAIQALIDSTNIAGADGDANAISMADLVKASLNTDGTYSDQEVQAAKYLKGKPELFRSLADKYGQDGKITVSKLGDALNDTDLLTNPDSSASAEAPKSERELYNTLRDTDSSGKEYIEFLKDKDGNITEESLKKVAGGKTSAPPKVRAAAKYLRENQDILSRWDKLDGKEDGNLNWEKVKEASKNKFKKKVDPPTSQESAYALLSKKEDGQDKTNLELLDTDGNGQISQAELDEAADNDKLTDGAKEAAKWLKANTETLSKWRKLNGDDSKAIHIKKLKEYAENGYEAVTEKPKDANDALKRLVKTPKGQTKNIFDLLGAKDGKLDFASIQKAADDESLNKEAREVAKYFSEHRNEWYNIAKARGSSSGVLNSEALNDALFNPDRPTSPAAAAQLLQDSFNTIKQGSASGNGIDRAALRKVVNDTTGKYDDKTKAAAQFFLDDDKEFGMLDVASDRSQPANNDVNAEDLKKYATDRPGGTWTPVSG